MSDSFPPPVTLDASEDVPGARQAGKARSRQSLLDAAKALFVQHGYEGATMREIAARAGLSTGAVFASFSDKADLFDAVLQADAEVEAEAMRKAADKPGSVEARLLAMLSAAFTHDLAQNQLLRAGMGAVWSHGLSGDLGDRPVRRPAVELIGAALRSGMANGELRTDLDVPLVVDMIWDGYLGDCRRAQCSGWGVEVLVSRLRRRLAVLLAAQRAE